MQVQDVASEHTSVTLSRAELVLLNNALNEAVELLSADEFFIRVGVRVEEALELQRQMKAVIQQMGRST